MKKVFIFLVFSLLFISGCSNIWHKTIDDNRITIKETGDYLDITVFVTKNNLDKFESHDDYVDLLTEAFADYLNISDNAAFRCPGLETVSTEENHEGHITRFRIPQAALKVLK